MGRINETGYADEPKELMQLCFECEKMDCTGSDGCAEYRKRKRELLGTVKSEPQPTPEDTPIVIAPAIEFVVATDRAAPEALQYFNSAIKALHEINKFGNGFMFEVAEMLEQLERTRYERFNYMIDWDLVAIMPLKEVADETA